jgi:hypothetical protein
MSIYHECDNTEEAEKKFAEIKTKLDKDIADTLRVYVVEGKGVEDVESWEKTTAHLGQN